MPPGGSGAGGRHGIGADGAKRALPDTDTVKAAIETVLAEAAARGRQPEPAARENTDLRRTLALYEEAIRQLALENDALRRGSTVVPLPTRSVPASP
ncbi:hypothetical protein [Streptomyces sp. NPDC012510]|uniref:hypothetical protein n=1 Tax=Streptomyces sp. NPDC012510 TaxID=3364838 RepID=UPI0036F07E70